MKLIPKHQKTKPNKLGSASRARACARSREGSQPAGDSIPQKIAASLATFLTEADLADVVAVYRAGLRATQRIWVEDGTVDERGRRRGHWEHHPDHRTRIACADMIAAYKEGLPVQRQAILVQKFETMDQTRERVAQSPELLKAIGNLTSGGVQVEASGQVIDVGMTVQESGGQNRHSDTIEDGEE